MKRLLCLLLALLMLPAAALAELSMEVDKNYITFPELEEMKCYFRDTKNWTIVHAGNLEEHLALVMQRGDTEEEIRARFARDTLIWEAYKTSQPKDACIRMERFVDETSRDVWHLRHLSTSERKAFLQQVNDGMLLPGYETFGAKYAGNGGTAYIDCGFTTIPPAAYESGRMFIRYINGQAFVLSYAVYDRMAGRSKLRTAKDKQIIESYSPFRSLKFGAKLLPKMPDFTLDESFPMQVDVADVIVSGQVTKGASLTVTLDGENVKCKVSGKGEFTVTLPVDQPGDHEVVFTTEHKKYTDRVERFTLNASAHRTPLTLTELPEEGALAGEQVVSGVSEAGAEIILRLDDREAVTLLAGEDGTFTHTFEVPDDQAHMLYAVALAPGKDVSWTEHFFYTEYETFKDGLDAFEDHLTDLSVGELAKDPASHLGERLKISVRVKEVTHTQEGLGVLCTYNPPRNSKHAKTPLYLTLYGYGQDQILPDMTMTVYATVHGLREVDGEERMELLVQYGTYLVVK